MGEQHVCVVGILGRIRCVSENAVLKRRSYMLANYCLVVLVEVKKDQALVGRKVMSMMNNSRRSVSPAHHPSQIPLS